MGYSNDRRFGIPRIPNCMVRIRCFKAEPRPPVPMLLYRRGGLSHALSQGLSQGLRHDLRALLSLSLSETQSS